MSTQLTADISEETVERIAADRDEPDWLHETRLEAVRAIEDLEFPNVITTPGPRRWTNLVDLDYDELVAPFAQTEQKEREAPDGVAVHSFEEALADDDLADVIEEHFGSVVDTRENRLVALSTALFTSGTVVHVPRGVDAQDVTVRTTMNGRSLFNYTLVVTEESAEVTILERQHTGSSLEGHRYYSGIVEVVGGENSRVQYGALQDFDQQTYNYTLKRGDADQYATIDFVDGNLGSRLTKTEVSTELNGDGSETNIVGAFFGQDDQHFDLDSKVWHRGEHTTADLVMRGVVDDTARSVYEGVQDVGADAWDTSSYQRERTLMLDDDAEADASPKLIINNHDTEASHSATVGQIDREDLFYMTSHGAPPRVARNMLVEGFFVPVLDEVDVGELRDDLRGGIAQRLRTDEQEA